jgi:hypothetical protein
VIALLQLLITLLLSLNLIASALPAQAPTTKRPGKVIYLPQMRQDQWEIASHPAKIKVICMGRRWGKTIMSGAIAVSTAAAGGRVAWVVPTYKNGRPLWRFVKQAVRGLKEVRANETERIIQFPNGGYLAIYSAENPDSILGENFNLVIVDEAARVSETMIFDAIMPTLADTDGDLILISTPKGFNWFQKLWSDARADMIISAAWTAPTSANPNPFIRKAFEMAQKRLPWRTFHQEWLAEFLPDGDGVFRFVERSKTAVWQPRRVGNHQYVFGVDLAKYGDWSVITVWDLTLRSLVHIQRFQGIDYLVQLERLRTAYGLFTPTDIVIERNGNETFIELAVRAGLPVSVFTTTNKSKITSADNLAIGFEQAQVWIVDPETVADEEERIHAQALVDELKAFTTQRTPGGTLTYAAPAGVHDDCVMSAIFGYELVSTAPDWESQIA